VLRGLTPLVTVTYASIAGTLMLGSLLAADGGMENAALRSPAVWGSVVYLAVFGTVLGFVWFYRGVQTIGAARAAQFINIVPLSGVLLGALVLDEPLTLSILTGGGMVVLGLWLTNSRRNPSNPETSTR
jgi:drug/metabolite transporter (DMT)-like permease